MGAEGIMAECRAHAPDLVGGDAHAYPRAANQDAPIEIASGDGLGYGTGHVRIVDSHGLMGAEVLHLDIHLLQKVNYLMLEVEPGVVASDGDFQWWTPSELKNTLVWPGARGSSLFLGQNDVTQGLG
jgi:hypothetical protein